MTQTLYERIEAELIDRDIEMKTFLEEYHISYYTIRSLKETKPSTQTYRKLAKFFNESGSQLKRYPIKKEA